MFTAQADARLASSAVRTREHDVTAVLVAHDGQRWLPRTLAALAAMTRAPDRLVAVDTGSGDATPELLRDSGLADNIVDLPAEAGFGEAVAAGLAAAAEPAIDLTDGGSDSIRWVWLLHDDSAPAPDALAQLLERADHYPDAQIVGPKLRGWAHPRIVKECGIWVTASGREEIRLGPGELDQGQLDGAIEAMAVSSAGMLVRAELWHRLGGFDPGLPFHRADVNFCLRSLRAGAQIVVAPHALVHHRGAESAGVRPADNHRGTGLFAARRARAYDRLVQGSAWHVPFLAVWLVLTALGRGLFWLLALSPGRAWDDLFGTLAGLLAVPRWRAARRALADVSVVTPAQLRPLRPTAAQQAVHYLELLGRTSGRGGTRGGGALSGFRWTLSALLIVALPLSAAALLATGHLWFGPGRLGGGALLPAPDSAADIWQYFLSPWHEAGLGSPVPSPPYLLLVAGAAVVLLGSATMAVQLLLLLAPALAGLSAAMALRGVVPRGPAMAVALAYGLLPATMAATGTGRLGTALAAVLLPPALRSLARLSGAVAALPANGAASVGWAAVLSAALAACVPLVAVALLAAAGVVFLFTGRWRAVLRVFGTAAAAAAFLWPWTGYVIANPGLLLLDVGAHPQGLTEPSATPASLLALLPGGPAMAPPFALVLVVLAVVALFPARSRNAAIVGWLLMALGLAVAVGQTAISATVPWTVDPVEAWPGAATVLMGAGAALAVAALGVSSRGGRWRAVVPTVAVVLPVVLAAVSAGWWMWDRETVVARQDPVNVSAYVTAEALGPGAPRSVSIAGDREGGLSYRVLSGPGARLGDADVAPAAESMREFDLAVSRLLTGGAADSLSVFADAAVRYVAVDARTNRDLARRLDAVPGLRRTSTVAGLALWSVDDWQPRVRAETDTGDRIPVPVAGLVPSVSVDSELPDQAAAIRLAEVSDPVWQAAVGDTPLAAEEADGVRFVVPAEVEGRVTVQADGSQRNRSLLIPAGAALLLVLLSLRRRRRRSDSAAPDPIIDLRDRRSSDTGVVPGLAIGTGGEE